MSNAYNQKIFIKSIFFMLFALFDLKDSLTSNHRRSTPNIDFDILYN